MFFMKEMKRKPIIAVDFDGTLCTECYPGIGAPNEPLIRWLIRERTRGSRLILWTCRCGELLVEAVLWCGKQGLYFEEINENLTEIKMQYGSNARKIYADLYIDDRACKPDGLLQLENQYISKIQKGNR